MAASLFTVPINVSLPWQTYKITLSGVIFTLEFRYNGRMNRWIMNVNDSTGVQVLQGIPVLIERNLLGQYVTLTLPDGLFFAVDNTGKDTQPGSNSFGVTHTTFYVDPLQ